LRQVSWRLREANPYGFKAAFSPPCQDAANGKAGWVSPHHFGINEGPTVIMIEDDLHGLTWRTMRACPSRKLGLMRVAARLRAPADPIRPLAAQPGTRHAL
jgi:hypothetical protein